MKSSQSAVDSVSANEANSSLGAPISPKALSLRANFSWTFMGNVVYAASQWGMLVVLAKLGSPEKVGQFALGLAICSPIIIFTNLQLRNVQSTDVTREYLFGDYLGLRLITILVALLLITGMVLTAGYPKDKALIIVFVGVAKAAEAISDAFYGMFQQHERFDRIAKSLVIKGPLSLLSLGALVYLTGEVLWGTVGLALTWSAVLLYDIHSGAIVLRHSTAQGQASPRGGETVRPRWNADKVKLLVWSTLPLGVAGLLVTVNPNVPRYFVEWYLGERSLGVFAALAYLIVAGNTVVLALGQSAMPRLAKYYSQGQIRPFQLLLFKLVVIGALLGLAGVAVAWLAGPQILTFLYSPEYAEQSETFLWIMAVSGVQYVSTFLNCGVMAARRFQAQLPIYALSTGASALLCFWLIPTAGLKGAAWGLGVAYIIQAVGFLLVNGYTLRTRISLVNQ